jgi:hypothetical protein|tara:strand:- start:10102 stop:10257 length:156 start_codon:yes stop_codon:yes gene_type:complete
MKKYINIYDIYAQIYLLPFIKVTHDKSLNGELELIFGWFNKELAITISKQK